MVEYGERSKMLPTHHRPDGKWDKFSVSSLNKVLAAVLFLLLFLQVFTSWYGRSLMQIHCPFPVLDISQNTLSRSVNVSDGVSSTAEASDLPAVQPNCNCTQAEVLPVVVKNCNEVEDRIKGTEDRPPPNSYFPDTDSDIWPCRQHHVDERNMTYREWLTGNFTDEQVLCAAHRAAKRPMAPGTPRIAFLFLTRGEFPLELVWRKFLAGHEDKFSIYVHSGDPNYPYPPESIFHNRTIAAKPVRSKQNIEIPAAIRRLISYALLDSAIPNAWFHFLCEATFPIRSFPFVYDYITNSDKSFVEAFYPTSPWWRENWNASGDMAIPDRFMRKGEAWITVHRRHAGLIVGDHYVFPRFKHHWLEWGFPSETYIPTLFSVADPHAIANHTLVYVDWVQSPQNSSSPVLFNETNLSKAVIRGMQNMTSNKYGFYQFDKEWNDTTEQSCVYNGVPNSPCFMFVRKFSLQAESVKHLLRLVPILGFR